MSDLDFNIQIRASDFLYFYRKISDLEDVCEKKDKRILELEEQLSCTEIAYKTLLGYINSQRTVLYNPDEFCEVDGHQLLNGKQILVVGACACKPKNLLGYAKRNYGFTNNDFRFVSDYEKIKNRQIRLRYDKLAGIIVGPVPHYSEGTPNDLLKFIMDWQDIVPVAICKSKNGEIKISKQAFTDSLIKVISDIIMTTEGGI